MWDHPTTPQLSLRNRGSVTHYNRANSIHWGRLWHAVKSPEKVTWELGVKVSCKILFPRSVINFNFLFMTLVHKWRSSFKKLVVMFYKTNILLYKFSLPLSVSDSHSTKRNHFFLFLVVGRLSVICLKAIRCCTTSCNRLPQLWGLCWVDLRPHGYVYELFSKMLGFTM